jgi:hypothetical protein
MRSIISRRLRIAVAAAALVLIPALALAAELPQEHDWQVALRNHLATLKPGDFVIDNHAFTFPETYEQQDDERVYRDVIVTAYQKKDRLQNIKIDLLGTGGKPTAMPRRAAVHYIVQVGHSLGE